MYYAMMMMKEPGMSLGKNCATLQMNKSQRKIILLDDVKGEMEMKLDNTEKVDQF